MQNRIGRLLLPGGFAEASRVDINGEVAIDAVPDGTPDAEGGGDRHSGGGGIGGTPKGGTNGGDAEDREENAGGHGSGFDLSSFALEYFLLTPGEGRGGLKPVSVVVKEGSS